jgi:hypothetical protein
VTAAGRPGWAFWLFALVVAPLAIDGVLLLSGYGPAGVGSGVALICLLAAYVHWLIQRRTPASGRLVLGGCVATFAMLVPWGIFLLITFVSDPS